MKAVGKLGSYISKSVYTVSGPFHPFGGAVDIIVVEQQDGSFKSSPWYVRFGKFQGVLKANEKVVSISVNGVEADFHMYLDHKGEAYFLKELDVEEGDSLSSPSSSGEDTDGQSHDRRPMKSKSCNYDAYESDSVTQIDLSNGNVISRSNSRRARILGLVFGRKSMKKDNNNFPEEGNDAGVIRSESMESAEIAADLLEVKWSTNLASPRQRKENTSRPFSQDISEANDKKDLMIKDGQTLLRDNIMDNSISLSEIGIDNNEESYSFRSIPTKSDRSVEDTGVGTSCLISAEDDGKPNLNLSRKTDNLWAADTDTSASMIGDTSEIAITESQIQDSVKLEECPGNKYQIDQVSKEMHDGFTDSSFSAEENRDGRIPAFLYCETSMSSELDGSNKRANGALCLSIGGCEQVYVETMQTTNFACEVSSQPATGLNEKEPSNIDGKTPQNVVTSSSSTENGFVAETFSQMITLEPVYASAEDIESGSIFPISTFSNSTCQALVEKTVPEEDEISQRETPVKPVGDPIQLNLLSSEISEEERLLFGDFDDFKLSSVRYSEEPVPPNDEKEGNPPCLQTETEGVNENFLPICIPGLSAEKSIHVNLPENAKDLRRLKTISSHIDIPATCGSQSEEVSRAARSLPNMSAHNYDLCAHGLGQSLNRSIDSDSKLLNQIDFLSNVETEADNNTSQTIKDTESIEKLTKGLPNPAVGDCSRSFDVPNGSRGIWSFPFKRSRSMKVSQVVSDSNKRSDENTTNRKVSTEGEKDLPTVKVTKNKTRSITPTSEQLASLNLKEGRNSVVFTFSTPMLGKQQVDARIYLWKWDTRVVISDVDGTITRSDLLGQFMPLVGVDWSQTGVAHLFSAIKENGYQLLFLSARAISQAYHTRQFLFNLKQDGKVLPEGPVVISPDGLFPSLYREVVRRAPHEFKIACLEDIKALFPSDRNPFYAGFGNRDTDEISYLKVGIPKGKIFIINPKGEIVVNRRIDTKSYTSLHAYVPDMFPPMSSCELEDFNSWNYWKLPPPAIDV